MPVIMRMAMVVVMPMAVMMVVMSVSVTVAVIMVVMIMVGFPMMDTLLGARAAWILAEDERFDRHRHGIGGNAYLAEVDIIEIHQHDAVDDEDFARHIAIFPQHGTKRLLDLGVRGLRGLLGSAGLRGAVGFCSIVKRRTPTA